LVAELYDRTSPIEISEHDLNYNYSRLIGRLVSATGRRSRVCLVDNIVGEFSNPQLSSLITATHISGQAPYGVGEEKRVNNLTYCLTANSASVDRDMASRCLYIILGRRNEKDLAWEDRVRGFITENRLNLFADILFLIKNSPDWKMDNMGIRALKFVHDVVQPMCRDEEEFKSVIAVSQNAKISSDIEEDTAISANEVIANKLDGLGTGIQRNLPECCCYIYSDVITEWFTEFFEGIRSKAKIMQRIRNFSKGGLMENVKLEPIRYPTNKPGALRGILWNPTGVHFSQVTVYVIGVGRDGKACVLSHVKAPPQQPPMEQVF